MTAPGPRQIQRAVEILRDGGLVAFPTETVYGLGADAENRDALRRLYEVKGRPSDHPVIVHLARPEQLEEWGSDLAPAARTLADACWPGPLTLVVRRAARVPDEVTGGLDTVGLRVPAHPVALELLTAFGGGLAAPSANRFGRVSPTTADAVRAELGDDVALVLDGGECSVGVESTIVDCTSDPPRVLRLGGVTNETLHALLGMELPVGGTTRAPGTLASHYAPTARVEVLTASEIAGRARALVDAGARVGVLAA
ncbi:MAG: L-threonylcarbamoyladenylate synthase, partial [Acidimicrobiia bacterium]